MTVKPAAIGDPAAIPQSDLVPGGSPKTVERVSLKEAVAEGHTPDDKPEPDQPPADEPGGEEPTEFDVPGLGTLSVDDIQNMARAAQELVELEKAGKGLTKRAQQLKQFENQVNAMGRLKTALSQNKDLAQKVLEALGEDAEEFVTAMIGHDRQPDDDTDADEPAGDKEPKDPEDEARQRWIDQQMYQQARTKVQTVVGEFAEQFPDLVKGDQAWIKNVLAPQVKKRFGTDVGIDHVRYTLLDLVHASGGIEKGRSEGQSRAIREALKKLPAGAQVVQAAGSRRSAAPPEPNYLGMDRKDIVTGIMDEVTR